VRSLCRQTPLLRCGASCDRRAAARTRGAWLCCGGVQLLRAAMCNCTNCVLLCTTRESARLWEKTGLFNLRLSSDAPNLQVENEETIEALSARTEALLDNIQQRFSFARSFHVYAARTRCAARQRTLCTEAARMLVLHGIARLPYALPSRIFLYRLLSPSHLARARFAETRSATIGEGASGHRSMAGWPQGPLRPENRISTTNDWSRSMSRQ
jgi:hypothetical protein